MRTLRARVHAPLWAFRMEQRQEAERAAMERRLTALITREEEQIMSLDDSVQRNTQDVTAAVAAATQEIQQLKDALANSATPEQIAAIDSASSALEAATTALQSDDPAAPPAA